jgi:hypothetical protein
MSQVKALVLAAVVWLAAAAVGLGGTISIPFPGPGANVLPKTIAFIGNNSNATDGSTWTYTSQSIGTAFADRLVVIALTGRDQNNSAVISSVTLAGNAMTKAGENATNQRAYTAFFYLSVPTGTTATIVVTASAAFFGSTIAVYALGNTGGLGPSSTNINSAASSTGISTTINIPAGGVAIGNCVGSSPATTQSWTNLTLDVTASYDSNPTYSAAHTSTIGALPSQSVGCNSVASATELAMSAAAW